MHVLAWVCRLVVRPNLLGAQALGGQHEEVLEVLWYRGRTRGKTGHAVEGTSLHPSVPVRRRGSPSGPNIRHLLTVIEEQRVEAADELVDRLSGTGRTAGVGQVLTSGASRPLDATTAPLFT